MRIERVMHREPLLVTLRILSAKPVSCLIDPFLMKEQLVGVFEGINKTSSAHYNGEDQALIEKWAFQKR